MVLWDCVTCLAWSLQDMLSSKEALHTVIGQTVCQGLMASDESHVAAAGEEEGA